MVLKRIYHCHNSIMRSRASYTAVNYPITITAYVLSRESCADNFIVLRRKAVDGYDISFLLTNFNLEVGRRPNPSPHASRSGRPPRAASVGCATLAARTSLLWRLRLAR